MTTTEQQILNIPFQEIQWNEVDAVRHTINSYLDTKTDKIRVISFEGNNTALLYMWNGRQIQVTGQTTIKQILNLITKAQP